MNGLEKWLAKVNQWRNKPTRLKPVPFTITCLCGHTVPGERQLTYQIRRCSNCHYELFVLPQSPFADSQNRDGTAKRAAPSSFRLRTRYLLVFMAALAATLLVVIGLLVLSFWPTSRPPFGGHSSPEKLTEQFQHHQQQADASIKDGHFQTALHHIKAQLELSHDSRLETKAAAVERRHKEIALYADRLEQPLEILLEHAINLPEKEWHREFTHRYHNKAVLLDLYLERNPQGLIAGNYIIQVQNEIGTLALTNLSTFEHLALERPYRVLFGARLQKIERANPGMWVVRFVPGSEVLLTDPQAAAICCPAWGTESARKILAAQKK